MPSINFNFNHTDQDIIDALKAKKVLFVDAVTTKMNYLLRELQQKIVNEKLSGFPLKEQSGKLKESVEVIPTDFDGKDLKGGVQAGGDVAPYAPIQEYGSESEYPIAVVGKKALTLLTPGKEPPEGATGFAAHVMHPPISPTHFMESALLEMTDRIEAEIEQTVIGVLNE